MTRLGLTRGPWRPRAGRFVARVPGARRPRRRRVPSSVPTVGWVVYGLLEGDVPGLWSLDSVISMRVGRIARTLNREGGVHNELYRPSERYDLVVFAKVMEERHRAEAVRAKERGAKIVYDVHVNYFETWGDYDVAETEPTPRQREDILEMTALADQVTTCSSYLVDVAARYASSVTFIPDNVDLSVFRGTRTHASGPLRLVWAGVAKKARQLTFILDVLADLGDAELTIVTDAVPDVLPELRAALPTRVVPYSDRRYARLLRSRDVIISPKRLSNAYELGHSEYKITLGMAAGLPAVASPQQSYIEALADGGGVIADTPDAWHAAFESLRDPQVRAALGERARRTVRDRYATPVVAQRYRDLFRALTA